MLVIKVELWPHGDMKEARELARGFIWNKGNTDHVSADYGVQLQNEPPFEGPMLDPQTRFQPTEQATVHSFPRDVDRLWILICEALFAYAGIHFNRKWDA